MRSPERAGGDGRAEAPPGPGTPGLLTVDAALQLEIFRRGGARVAAGAGSLGRGIRWVHSAEIPDIAQFLAGGELLLTAGCGIGATEADQRRYVRSVAAADVAALAIELSGRAFTTVPPAVVDEAECRGLALITFDREIPFVEVASQVHNRIVDLRVEELTRQKAIDSAFTDLLLRGEDYLAVVEETARSVCLPVVLEDYAHQMRAYYGRTPHSDEVLAEWGGHSRLDHHRAEAVRCTMAPIALRGEVWGFLHVLHGDAAPTGAMAYVIERAAAAVAITLVGEQIRGVRRSQRATALTSRLMLGDIDGKGFVDRALEMGRDLRGRSFVAVVASRLDEDEPFGEEELGRHLAAAGAGSIIADTGDRTLAVVALPPKKGERAVVDSLRPAPARVGISRVVPAERLVAAVHEARSAVAAATPDPDHRLVRFEDLGVLRLLMALADKELASYVEDELGSILAHDAASANPLLPTLRAFLECDGRKTEAAQKLFVQRRTLYYRLDRIDTMLHRSLDQPDTRHRLLLALRGLDLLRHRSQGPRTTGAAADR
jgi:PucR family transcriptional regulator, purine catabolism regulatory protein